MKSKPSRSESKKKNNKKTNKDSLLNNIDEN